MTRIFHSSNKSPEIAEITQVMDGAWLHLEGPNEEELIKLSTDYKLDIDLLKDGIDINESPRIERDGEQVYIFTRFCLPEAEKLTTAPLLIVYAKGITVTVSERPFTHLDQLTKGPFGIITSKRAQLVLEILQAINSGYKRRINIAGKRIMQTRSHLDKDQISNKDFIGFIDIEEDLYDFLLVLEPMTTMLHSLLNGRYMRLYEEDKDLIEDLSLGTQELATLARSRLVTLRNIREAYSTIAANDLNKIIKFMTSVTILIGILTFITGVYGMNVSLPFENDPRAFIYIAVGATLLISTLGYYFKRNRWF